MAVTPNIKTTNNYFERTETLVKYYHDANEYDVLDADREKELFTLLNEGKANLEKAKQSGNKALQAKYEKEVESIRTFIINSNLRFVISVARVYATNNNILDIIDEGNIGLIEAVDTFDVSLGNRFQTHAVYLIRQKINLFRQGDGLMIRKNNESKTYHIISNMTNKFIQEFQREPTSDELKDYINENYPNAKIKDSADVLNVRIASIDEPVDSDDGDANIGNISAFNSYSASTNEYDGEVEIEHLSALINTLMRGLSERDKTIIKMYFGIGQKFNAPCPVSEIADKTKLTKERVRQIITDVQNKMRMEYEKNIDSFLNN
jgi:RNA polymerase primary sigma factor